VSRGERLLAPRRDLREQHLPWASLSFRRGPGPDKGLRLRPVISACGAACSKGASSVFGRPIPRAGIAATPVAETPSGGGGAGPAGPGGPATSARLAGASKRGGIVSGSRSSFCPNRSSRPKPLRPALRLPRHARASAQRQNLTIFRSGGARGPAATWCSLLARPGRRNASVRAAAAGRSVTSWIAKPATVSGDAAATGDPGRHRHGRRDVFTGCAPAVPSG